MPRIGRIKEEEVRAKVELASVIVVASTKGGAGKTTLAACLAVRAAKNIPRVALIDLDPQQSLLDWWERRGKPRNPMASFDDDGDLKAEIENLSRHGADLIIIDTPPALVDVIDRAVYAADFVVIPVKASGLDLTSIDAIVDLCNEANKPFGIVLNDAEPAWKITKSAAEALATSGPLLGTVTHRAGYVTAMTTGKTGPESSDAKQAATCAAEVEALWIRITDAMGGLE